jgi:hypothetical protein
VIAGIVNNTVSLGYRGSFQLQLLHEEELHEEQPADAGLSTPLIPKTENFLRTFLELHFSQETSLFPPETSFSKVIPQSLHMYSNIGITDKKLQD